jgi:catechol 2,3-dioxygenase-like lactoylglutathione lyase family enzyme
VKLGHLAYNTPAVQKAVDFYCNVLGFRFSDSIEDFFVFLRCNADHHTINLVGGKRIKMHHIAFELRDWNHMQNACDYLSMNGYPLIWGPGRHGIGHNLFTYHRNPDGQIVELFAELDLINEDIGVYEPRPWHRDRPQKPKVWPNEVGASNLWGIMPSPDFLD